MFVCGFVGFCEVLCYEIWCVFCMVVWVVSVIVGVVDLVIVLVGWMYWRWG